MNHLFSFTSWQYMMKLPFSGIQLQIKGNLPEDMWAFFTSFGNSMGVRAFLQICESSVQKIITSSLYNWSPPACESPGPPKEGITYMLTLWNDSVFSGLKLNLCWIISSSLGSAFPPSLRGNSITAALNSRLSYSASVFYSLDPLPALLLSTSNTPHFLFLLSFVYLLRAMHFCRKQSLIQKMLCHTAYTEHLCHCETIRWNNMKVFFLFWKRYPRAKIYERGWQDTLFQVNEKEGIIV